MPSAPTQSTSRTAPSDLSESDRFRLLSVERRRITMDVLSNCPTPVDLEDVALAVASHEQDVGTPDDSVVERVATSLHHTHLPKMDDWGVVDYDPAAGRIV